MNRKSRREVKISGQRGGMGDGRVRIPMRRRDWKWGMW